MYANPLLCSSSPRIDRQVLGTAVLIVHKVDVARLVRGEDRYGHFQLTPGPRGMMDPRDIELLRPNLLKGRQKRQRASQKPLPT